MHRSLLALIGVALGCQPSGDAWTEADIQHPDDTQSGNGSTYGVDLAILTGEVEIIPKTSIEGSVEFIAGVYNPAVDDFESIGCVIDLELRSETWRPDCEACEEAYDFLAPSYSIHVDDGSCREFDFTEDTLSSFQVALGFSSDQLYYSEEPGEWDPVAETLYSEGFTRFEWVIELD